MRRSAAQMSDDEKASHADYLIDNSGPPEDTKYYVDVLWDTLQYVAANPEPPRGRPN